MIKPYLAVIVDSFHSALSSRILWIAMVAIWIFLAALAPIGYHEDYTTTFRWFDLDNGTQMKAMLARGLVDPQESDTALGRLARTFPEDIKRKLRQVARGEDVRIDKGALADSLNESLDDEDWYDAEAWRTTVRLRELRELDEVPEDEISEPERRRRARLRIEAALPGVFTAMSARSITLSYAGFDFPAFFLIGKEQFVSLINQFVVPIMMDWLLGFALIFLGILVTASIIPDMLQPGSLHLLLSKPISRTMLLLSKFVGGCAFVFLCVCQLVVGLWLISGFRLDIWNARVLWCIPVAVFLFAVFFSVSLLAGLRWRSPILSIGVTCMFGAFVLVIGFIGGYFDALVRAPDRIAQMSFDGQDIVTATRGGELKRFDSESNQWADVIEGDFRRRDLIVPPVRIAPGKIATARIRGGRFNLYGSGSLDLLVLDRSQDWKPNPGLRLPNGTRRLLVVGNLLIALNNTGLMATTLEQALDESGIDGGQPEPSSDDRPAESDSDFDVGGAAPNIEVSNIGVTAWITDLIRMQGGATEAFDAILPQGVTLTDPVRLDVLADRRSLVVYARGRLMRLDVPAGGEQAEGATATLAADLMLDDNDAARTTMAATGRSVLLARADEPVRWYQAETLALLAEFPRPEDQTVVAAEGLGATDQFALLTTDGSVSVATRSGDRVELETLPQSEVTAIEYDEPSQRLAIAHHIDSIDFVTIAADATAPAAIERAIRPSLTSWRSVDRYVITPLRTLTPQTGELSQTVAALVSGKTSFAIGDVAQDEQEVVQLKIVRPVVSCSLFLAVMLTLSCLYFARRDF
ncbi:ABC-2 family transporter protein [Stieleria neptunia]|uniref:ABC-2 family transporter protein n=1 Tax=Stieleria neptunia TaxID=2527979 RepID=A0A518HL04_9BACT|nr:ABC transporter permease [Stieleria neptunia]QDV41513.1 ABC-2 family transporter protein [Stieleria neptunia]